MKVLSTPKYPGFSEILQLYQVLTTGITPLSLSLVSTDGRLPMSEGSFWEEAVQLVGLLNMLIIVI